jgi:hypothetical protein
MKNFRVIYLLPLISIISVFIGWNFKEDSLGGAAGDYSYHLKYFYKFSDNFYETLKNFGSNQLTENVRNSPVFYIILSFFLKIGFSINALKFINSLVLIPIIITFFKCLEIKFNFEKNINAKIYFFSIILLSPTVRSMLFWPYPFLWAILFFLISIYFYLNFIKNNSYNEKFRYACFNIISLSLSAYFTPNFAVFAVYFFYNFMIFFKNERQIIFIIFLNLILSIPAVYFLISKDFYLFSSEVYRIEDSVKYNISNKIVIILSIMFLFIIPFLSIKELKKIFINFNVDINLIFCLLFFGVNVYFYNFQGNAGGGIFYHLSQLIFNNSIILFVIFFITILLFYFLRFCNINNLIIFFILIIYNLQFSIYYKYYDPLLLFILLFLFKFNYKLDLDIIGKKYLVFYSLFLLLNLSKSYITY